jgi:hypothetical protein
VTEHDGIDQVFLAREAGGEFARIRFGYRRNEHAPPKSYSEIQEELRTRDKHHRIGMLSNLGSWPAPEEHGGDSRGTWYFAPPSYTSAPFAAGCLTWNGRLSLTTQIHPALRLHARDLDAIMNGWAMTIANLKGIWK